MRGRVSFIVEAIDPGVHACACAWARDTHTGPRLYRVHFAPAGSCSGTYVCNFETPDLVVVERPEYQGARSDAARTQDTIDLTWAGAQAAYSVGVPVIELTPHEWKGSEQKPPHHLRLWEDCLTDAERKLFPADTGTRIMKAAEKCALHPGKPGADYYGKGKGHEVHNLLDAAALALTFVGRFK